MAERSASGRTPVSVRPATVSDAPTLRQIERSAGEQFRSIGMPEIADDEPPSEATLAAYAADGRCWVATDANGAVVGYVLVDVVDGNAHIEQISVGAELQGHGIGRRLLAEVARWATNFGVPAITLTTFRDVPWNAPLYRRWGFVVLDPSEVGPQLRALRDEEASHGLDPTTRVCMRLDLAS